MNGETVWLGAVSVAVFVGCSNSFYQIRFTRIVFPAVPASHFLYIGHSYRRKFVSSSGLFSFGNKLKSFDGARSVKYGG